MFYQITTPRLQELDRQWGAVFNTSRGPVPRSLGLCHMLAETNGVEQPVTHSTAHRTVGIMRLNLRDTVRMGYEETTAQDARTNIYLWCRLANVNAGALHTSFLGWWQKPNLDFWLAVRLFFVLGPTPSKNLLTTVGRVGPEHRSTAGVIDWIRTMATPTQRFGQFSRFDLLQLADHLDSVLVGMSSLDGPQYVAAHFNSQVAPSGDNVTLFVKTQEYPSVVTHLEMRR